MYPYQTTHVYLMATLTNKAVGIGIGGIGIGPIPVVSVSVQRGIGVFVYRYQLLTTVVAELSKLALN